MRLSGWPLIAVLYCYGLLLASFMGKMFPIIGAIADELGVKTTVAAWLISCVVMLAIVGLPVVGALVSRFGPRRLLGLGAAAGLLANLGVMACHSFGALLAARLVEGVSFSLIMVAGSTLMAGANAGARQAAAMALWATSGAAGIGISQSLSGLAAVGAWRHVFGWSAVAFGVATLAIPLLPELPRTSPSDSRSHGLLSSYTNLRLLKLCVTTALLANCTLAIASVFPTYMHQQLGIDIARASFMGGLASVGSIAGSLGGTWMLARGFPPARLTIVALMPIAISSALVFVPNLGPLGVTAALIASSASIGVAAGGLAAMLPLAVAGPAALGPGIGMYYQMINVGALLGAPSAFALYVAGGSTGLLAFALIVPMIMVLAMPWRGTQPTAPLAELTSPGL